MSKIFRKRHTAVGARPGTLVIDENAETPKLDVFEYSEAGMERRSVARPADLVALMKPDAKYWVNVAGLGDEKTLREVGEVFGMHALALEDIVNVPQRPKLHPYEDHLLIVTRMMMLKEDMTVASEQVSVLIGKNFVLTVQEHPGDVFDPVRERLRVGTGPIRRMGPDYLAYAMLDAVIDGYYPVLEAFGDYLEDTEIEIVDSARPDLLRRIHAIKRDLLSMRRAVWPHREVFNALIRDGNPFVTDDVRTYLRDCYDHCVQIMDAVETYRELTAGLMDLYLSCVGNRQNEVMKVLTIMASIFIPLTFMAGIYGMNFENMPELHSRWGYPVLLTIMAAMAVGMFVFFRKKGWIGSRDG